MITTSQKRSTKMWGFVLRSEDGRIVGYGRVVADDQIEAVSTARMVRLDDVLPAITPVVGTSTGGNEIGELFHSVCGVVLDWSRSNPEGA